MNEKLGDTAAITYRLKEAEQIERLKVLTNVDDAGNVSAELGLIRFLIEESVASKNLNLAGSLMTTLSRLARVHDRQQIERGNMLTRAVVLRLAARIVSIVSSQFNTIPGWEAKMDAALVEITNEIDAAENPPELIPKA